MTQKTVGKTVAEQQYFIQTLDAIVPLAVSFLREGGQANQFRGHLLTQEAEHRAASVKGRQQSGLIARGIDVTTLNGEVEAAVHEAALLLIVEQWHNVEAWKPNPPTLYDYVRDRLALSEEAQRLLKPTIDRALLQCMRIR